MSQTLKELLDQYCAGEITRREFINRSAETGVSMAVVLFLLNKFDKVRRKLGEPADAAEVAA